MVNHNQAEVEFRNHENYQTFLARWFRGSNAGHFGPLYITSRGKGTSLFLSRGRKGKESDLRLAQLSGQTLTICTLSDPLNIAGLGKLWSLNVVSPTLGDVKADGTLKK
jgi:hypothetical protein